MSLWLKPDRLFDGERLSDGLSVRIKGDEVVEVAQKDDGHPLPGTLTPGFLDLQVNGGGGLLFNTEPIRANDIAEAHRAFGTVAILPTVITDAPGVAERAAAAITQRPGILGLHLEGPHIARARRGTHAEAFIRPLDDHTLTLVENLRKRQVPVMITLAPEAATPEQIATLARMGAIVSLGHSDAPAPVVQAALAAGATAFTHLFNAMSQMQGRQPGMVGTAINSTAFVGIIADGHHVTPDMIGLALRARPAPDLTFLVSDAMPTVGGSEVFQLYGQDIRVKAGRLVNAEGKLAGSHSTMADGLRTLVEIGIGLESALRMAITVPNRVIGADLARLTGRHLSDLFVLQGGMPTSLLQIVQKLSLP